MGNLILPRTLIYSVPLTSSLQVGHDVPQSTGQASKKIGITKQEYHERRKKLMDALPDGSVAVLRAGHIKYMSKNIL
jgi:Aminopeptidase P, N-terminal domain